jgi:hypothetical protein
MSEEEPRRVVETVRAGSFVFVVAGPECSALGHQTREGFSEEPSGVYIICDDCNHVHAQAIREGRDPKRAVWSFRRGD